MNTPQTPLNLEIQCRQLLSQIAQKPDAVRLLRLAATHLQTLKTYEYQPTGPITRYKSGGLIK